MKSCGVTPEWHSGTNKFTRGQHSKSTPKWFQSHSRSNHTKNPLFILGAHFLSLCFLQTISQIIGRALHEFEIKRIGEVLLMECVFCHEQRWRCSIFPKQGVRVNMCTTKTPRSGWSEITQSNTASSRKSQRWSLKTQLSLLVKSSCTWRSSRVTWEGWCLLRELGPALGIRKYVRCWWKTIPGAQPQLLTDWHLRATMSHLVPTFLVLRANASVTNIY